MRWRDIGDQPCSVARSLSVVGDRWTLLVLRESFLGVRRFDDYQARVGATRHVLADRLRKLVEHGILDRVPYRERPIRHEYRLTEKGLDLYPVIAALLRWGDRWMAGEEGPPIEVVHRSCGHAIVPELSCPDCGEPVSARDVRVRPGAALGARGAALGARGAALRARGPALRAREIPQEDPS